MSHDVEVGRINELLAGVSHRMAELEAAGALIERLLGYIETAPSAGISTLEAFSNSALGVDHAQARGRRQGTGS